MVEEQRVREDLVLKQGARNIVHLKKTVKKECQSFEPMEDVIVQSCQHLPSGAKLKAIVLIEDTIKAIGSDTDVDLNKALERAVDDIRAKTENWQNV